MKKTLLLTCALALVFAFAPTNSVSAQNGDYKQNIYAGAGFSLVGGLFDALGSDTSGAFTTSSLPAIQFNYDYALTPKISVGAAFSYQAFGFDVMDYTFVDASQNSVTEDFSANLRRTNLALRIMFHYGNSEKLDMYSGVRLGMTGWNISSESTTGAASDFFDGSYNGWGFAPQVIPFGLRFYVTNNIGLSLESAIGAPHFLSIGANYRL
jgi:hypothetical protein